MKAKARYFIKFIKVLAAVGVAGILFGFVAFKVLSDPRKEMRSSNVKTGTHSIYAKGSSYYLDTGHLPESIEDLISSGHNLSNWKGPYVTEQQSRDTWGHRYIIRTPGTHNDVDVISLGADGREGGTGNNADIGNWQ